jgi:hypothetical protein
MIDVETKKATKLNKAYKEDLTFISKKIPEHVAMVSKID